MGIGHLNEITFGRSRGAIALLGGQSITSRSLREQLMTRKLTRDRQPVGWAKTIQASLGFDRLNYCPPINQSMRSKYNCRGHHKIIIQVKSTFKCPPNINYNNALVCPPNQRKTILKI